METALVLEKVAPTRVPIMLQASTCSGRERIARLVHEMSLCASGPFVTLDCSTLRPETMMDVIFGADGVLAQAAKGTLFLDRIDQMHGAVQDRLFPLLDRNQVAPRLLTGTPVDLLPLISTLTFDEQLYFRLAIARIKLSAG